MALWKPFRGSRAELEAAPKYDGYVYFCDDGALFFDYADADGVLQRKQINAKDAETLMGMSLDEIKADVVRYDVIQDLADEQKAQARENIGAVSSAITEQEGGINLLNPANAESGYYEGTVGTPLIAYSSSNHQRTIEPIPLEDAAARLYVYVDSADSNYNWLVSIQFIDENGNYTGTCNFRQDSTSSYTIPSWYGNPVAMHVWINGVNYGYSLSNVCISATELDAFEPYQEPKTVVKKDALSTEALKAFAPLNGKTIVNFGDSIFGNSRPPRDISTEIAKLTGATVHNCGFGGCRMAEHSQANFDAFSMYRLAYAISGGDFTAQENALTVTENAVPYYFAETLALLKSIDFNKVDIITIAYGTNDFTGGVDLDNNTGSASFGGALRISIECLLYAYPHLKIFICSPIYRFWTDTGKDSDTYTPRSDGAMLSAFVEKSAEIAQEYHLPFVNNYDGLGFNKTNRGYYFSANDGTHPNEKGNLLIAANIADALCGSTSAAVYGADTGVEIPDVLTVQTVNANSVTLNGVELTGYIDEADNNKKLLIVEDSLIANGDITGGTIRSQSTVKTFNVAGHDNCSLYLSAGGSSGTFYDVAAIAYDASTSTGMILPAMNSAANHTIGQASQPWTGVYANSYKIVGENGTSVELTNFTDPENKKYITSMDNMSIAGDVVSGAKVSGSTLEAWSYIETPTVMTKSILGNSSGIGFDIQHSDASQPLNMFSISYDNGNRYFVPAGANTYLGEPNTPWDNVYAYSYYKKDMATGAVSELATKTDVDGLDNVLREILAEIRSGSSALETIDAIENTIVSYLETKTVAEVE